MNIFKKAIWPPFIAGSLLGVLLVITMIMASRQLADSATFVKIAGFIVSFFSLEHISTNNYFAKFVEYQPVFDWQFMLLLGAYIGSILSGIKSGITFTTIPYLWSQRFGFSKTKRSIFAFLGGFLAIFGARFASGSFLGHGISGTAQLATISWIFVPFFFLGGIVTTSLIYKKINRDN